MKKVDTLNLGKGIHAALYWVLILNPMEDGLKLAFFKLKNLSLLFEMQIVFIFVYMWNIAYSFFSPRLVQTVCVRPDSPVPTASFVIISSVYTDCMYESAMNKVYLILWGHHTNANVWAICLDWCHRMRYDVAAIRANSPKSLVFPAI